MNKEKEVKELLNKCDNCKLKECIGCEFTCTEIQKIKEYVEQKETILDKVTDKLKEDRLIFNYLVKEKSNVIVNKSLFNHTNEILNIIEGEKIMKKFNLALNEMFMSPIKIEDIEETVDNGFIEMQETIIAQVVEMEDKALVQAIRDYAQQKAIKEKENIRLMLLDKSIADKIIKLGVEEYIKIQKGEEKNGK